jgi:hypothetical protein
MTLHVAPAQAITDDFFLQLLIVALVPVSFDVLQPRRTFSSGVPLPRTINWGGIHFFLLSFMFLPPLRLWHPFQRDVFLIVNHLIRWHQNCAKRKSPFSGQGITAAQNRLGQ